MPLDSHNDKLLRLQEAERAHAPTRSGPDEEHVPMYCSTCNTGWPCREAWLARDALIAWRKQAVADIEHREKHRSVNYWNEQQKRIAGLTEN